MSFRALRHLPLWLWLGRAAIAAVILLSLLPLPRLVHAPPGGDKIEHFATWLALMLWYGQLCADRRSLALRALGLLALGVAIELGQALTKYRSAEWLDLAADALGVGLGYLLGLGRAGLWLARADSK